MKIDFDKKIINFEGGSIKDESGREMTVREVCTNALLITSKEEKTSGAEKLKRYDLALGIYQGKTKELTTEDVVLIKKIAGKYLSTMIDMNLSNTILVDSTAGNLLSGKYKEILNSGISIDSSSIAFSFK